MANNEYVSLLNRFNIGECSGATTINKAKDVFSEVGSDFKNIDIYNEATPATTVEVYKFLRYSSLYFAFRSLNSDFDKLVFTQNQIVEICEKYPSYLNRETSTFFLTKIKKQYVVVMAVAKHKEIWLRGALDPNQAEICSSKPSILVPLSPGG